MADPTDTLAEPAATAPPAGKVRMLAPDGVVYSVDGAQSKAYAEHGYTPYAGPSVDEDSIEAKFGAWRRAAGGTVQAAGLGAVNQVPFLDAGLEAVAPDTAKSLAEATRDARAEHPYAYGTGSVAGALGTYAAGGALLKGAAGAAGLAARVPGLAAMAEGSPLVTAGVKGAASNMALNVADQVDSAALEHALSPEGQEKTAFSYGQLAWAGLLGGAIPVGAGALSALPARAARATNEWAGNRLVSEFVSADEQAALQARGFGTVTDEIVRPLVERGQGSEHVVGSLTNEAHSLSLNHDNFLTISRDHPLTLNEARDVLARARAAMGNTPVGEDDLQPLIRAVESQEAAANARTAFNEARSHASDLGKPTTDALATPSQMEASKAVAAAKASLGEARKGVLSLPNDRVLKEMGDAIAKRVNNRAPLHNGSYQELLNAGRILSDARDTIFRRVATPAQAAAFATNRQALSRHLAALESLNKKFIPDVQQAYSKVASSAAIGGTMAALGLKGGTILGSAGFAGGMAGIYYANTRHLAAASQRLASRLVNADRALAKAIKTGLYATSAPRVALHKYDFQTQAASVKAAANDPATAFSSLHGGLLKAGAPEQVADKVAPRLHAINQASHASLPKPANTPDIASAAQPDLHQQRAWLSERRSRIDPTYALTYPTAQNMAAAKEHHPETIMRAQEAVMDALHKNPYLPLASRMWASRVLGRPAGGLTNPTFYQSLAQMRAKADAEAQQAGGDAHPSTSRGNGASGMAQSEQSRLGELSTR